MPNERPRLVVAFTDGDPRCSVPFSVRLRRVLKSLLRSHGVRAVEILDADLVEPRPEAVAPPAVDQVPGEDRKGRPSG